ncbi:MAG: AAA family ATPase [Thermoguttaceae bacterium]
MWHGIIGHDKVVEQFRRALRRGRLGSSFLFAGPAGIGKRSFAVKFAQALLCEKHPEEALDPCEHCPGCIQVIAGTHPDFQLVAKPDDKSFIPLELLIGDKEHRRREGLCHHIALKPRAGGRKIAVIDDADYLNAEGANALLKTLEEPPPRSLLILIGASPARQLPTIRSRCQLIRFQPLDAESLARLLPAQGIAADAADAQRLARYGEGSIQRAGELADAELWKFRNALHQRLAAERLDSVSLARLTAKFVDEAGKDAAPRRRRLHQVIGFAADFYRRLLRAANGAAKADNAEDDRLIDEALKRQSLDIEKTIARLERCLEADQQVDRNANQSTLIETWLDDLSGV